MGICEKMNALIWVESEVGVGSTFYFSFEADQTSAAISRSELNPFAHTDSKMGCKSPLRILVVDDNQINQMVAIGFLAKLGYRADSAKDGREALDLLFGAGDYDLVLMIVTCRLWTVFEATTRVLEHFRGRKRPRIVALTASSQKEDIARCLAVGMDDFISKPIEFQPLMTCLTDTALGREVGQIRVLSSNLNVQAAFDEKIFSKISVVWKI